MSTTSAPTMDRRNTPGPYGEPHADVNATTAKVDSKSQAQLGQQQQQQQQSTQSLKSQSQTQSQPPQPDSQSQKPTQTPSQSQSQTQPGEATETSKTDKQNEGDKNAPPEDDGEYPEQLHAGRLDGPGPEYGAQNRTGVYERMKGVSEQIKGTVKRDPDMKQRGHDRMTGQLKKKEKEQEEKNDPFKNAPDEDDKDKDKDESKDDKSSQQQPEQQQQNAGSTQPPQPSPAVQDDKGAHEQAESVRPEGEDMTQEEKEGKGRQEAGGV